MDNKNENTSFVDTPKTTTNAPLAEAVKAYLTAHGSDLSSYESYFPFLRVSEEESRYDNLGPDLDSVARTGDTLVDTMDLDDLIVNSFLQFDITHSSSYRKRKKALSLANSIMLSCDLQRIRKRISDSKRSKRYKHSAIIAQSSAGDDAHNLDAVAPVNDAHQVLVDISEEPVQVGSSATNDTGEGDFIDPIPISRFFERPVPILDTVIPPSDVYGSIANVWDLWSSNPMVRAKLQNYAFFRGNLKLKISFSATPFHYGKFIFAFYPYHLTNSPYQEAQNLYISNDAGRDCANTYYSQAPEVAILDVRENIPYVMHIPFISYKERWRIGNTTSVITNTDSLVDFEEAGQLMISQIGSLRVANDDLSSSVSLNIYAWVEDIELTAATATDFNINAQMAKGDKKHRLKRSPMYSKGSIASRMKRTVEAGAAGAEYDEPGPVTKIASSVADVAGALSSVPIIEPFAKATAMVATSVGKFASIFGFSKPAVLDNSQFVKNNPFVNGMVLAAHDTTYRMTADPKQEHTIDNRFVGGDGSDELSISYIASRETYLTRFDWTSSDLPLTDVLWKSLVTPYLYNACEILGRFQVWPTSMMFAAQPFLFWRGTVRFRFEVIVSKFHRGKLIIQFEPNLLQSALLLGSSAKLNENNTIVLDIQESTDVTVDVDWAYDRAWCNSPASRPVTISTPSDLVQADTSFVPTEKSNGFITVRVLNELVQPTATATAQVNVYVSCPDLRVNKLSQALMPTSRDLVTAQAAEGDAIHCINPTGLSTDHISDTHFGEEIVSFRSALKRYHGRTRLTTNHTPAAAHSPGYVRFGLSTFPQYLPIFPSVLPASSYTDGDRHLLTYLAYGYLGYRGSIRHRVIPRFGGTAADGEKVMVNVGLRSPQTYSSSVTSAGSTSGDVGDSLDNGLGLLGNVVFHPASNGGIEYEVPFMSRELFNFTGICDMGDSSPPADYTSTGNHQVMIYFYTDVDTTTDCNINLAYSVGEDFNFFRYNGAPPYNGAT